MSARFFELCPGQRIATAFDELVSLEQHMGLGKSAAIVGLAIQWPGDAQPQRFTSVPKNQAIEIKQSASDYRVIERPRNRMGGNHGR